MPAARAGGWRRSPQPTCSGLSNGYYPYFFLLPIGVVIGIELVRPRLPRTRILRDLAVAGVVVAAVMAPVALVYIRLQRDMGSRAMSASWAG